MCSSIAFRTFFPSTIASSSLWSLYFSLSIYIDFNCISNSLIVYLHWECGSVSLYSISSSLNYFNSLSLWSSISLSILSVNPPAESALPMVSDGRDYIVSELLLVQLVFDWLLNKLWNIASLNKAFSCFRCSISSGAVFSIWLSEKTSFYWSTWVAVFILNWFILCELL